MSSRALRLAGKTEMDVKDFYYERPKELIAQDPLEDRSSSRLLVLDQETGAISHQVFKNIKDYIEPGDCLVLNNTKVISSALGSLAVNVYKEYEGFGGSMNFISPGFVSMMNNTGTILSIIPLILLYLFCQKSFVEGIERSGIVG